MDQKNEEHLEKKKKTRKRFNSGKSSSEFDLATAERDHHRAGFPPGITVDELWLYRRKRPSENKWPHDNLHLREGSFKALKTEYRRRFRNYYDPALREKLSIKIEDLLPPRPQKPEDCLKLEGSLELLPEYNEFFIEYPIERAPRLKTISSSLQVIDSVGTEMTEVPSSEVQSSFVKYPTVERPHLVKRPTNLKLEGELYTTTESAEKFIQYLLTRRPDLARRATTLKLEGEMDTKTEMTEQFVPLDYQSRPPLCKKLTNLHLEGDLDILTEKQDKFKPHQVERRLPVVKQATNLHMEGDLDFMPEYRREFIEYKTERPKPALPVNNLKTDGFYDVVSTVSKPFEQQMHPQIPFLRGPDIMVDYDLASRSRNVSRRSSHLKLDGPVEPLTESRRQYVEKPLCRVENSKAPNNLCLEGGIDMHPEYRNAYVDFSKDRSVSPGATRSRRVPQQSHFKSEGKMDTSPEYSHSYVDFPRERPRLRRPECSLSSEGEMSHTTEKNAKYVSHPNVPKTEPIKRPSELKLEGHFECQPEYRKAYIDYLIREKVERKSRPLDNLVVPTKRAAESEPVERTSVGSFQNTAIIANGIAGSTVNKENLKQNGNLQLKIPSSPRASSSSGQTPSSPRPPLPKRQAAGNTSRSNSIRSPRNRSLSQIESSIFGPKLTVPQPTQGRRMSGSRSPSPVASVRSSRAGGERRSRALPRSKTVSPSSEGRTSRNKDPDRRFGSPVRVENIACRTPTTAPLPPLRDFSTRNKWMRDSSVESSTAAFVVLDKEINNNNLKHLSKEPQVVARDPRRLSPWYNPSY